MSDTIPTVQTAESVRKEAEAAYAAQHPAPEPPIPSSPVRPRVVGVGDDAHLWFDVINESMRYGSPRSPHAALFIVQRESGKDQRIQGDLSTEALEALIDELLMIKAKLAARQTYAEANKEHQEAERLWEGQRDEYARQQVANWQKAQKR